MIGNIMSLLLTPDELINIFQPLSNWQDRYRQIIQLARILPNMPEEQRTETNLIEGCENKVWLDYQFNEQQFIFYGDSEGRIVKGLLAILITLANDKTTEQIANTDFLAFLQQLNIINELSESRQLGIHNIISKIKAAAKSHH